MSDEYTVDGGRVSYTSPRPFESPSATVELSFTVAAGSDYDAVVYRVMASAKAQVYGILQAPATATLPPSQTAERAKRGAKAAPVADPIADPMATTAPATKAELTIGGTAEQTAAAKAALAGDPMQEPKANGAASPATALVATGTASPMDAGDDLSAMLGGAPAEISDDALKTAIGTHLAKHRDGAKIKELAAAFGCPPTQPITLMPQAQRPVFLAGLDKLGSQPASNGAM